MGKCPFFCKQRTTSRSDIDDIARRRQRSVNSAPLNRRELQDVRRVDQRKSSIGSWGVFKPLETICLVWSRSARSLLQHASSSTAENDSQILRSRKSIALAVLFLIRSTSSGSNHGILSGRSKHSPAVHG
eukprot:scpid55850/ scgid25750/ 